MQVHAIVDDSGSMYVGNSFSMTANYQYEKCVNPFIRTIREEFDSLADRLESPDLSFTFHLFSDTVVTGRRLIPMPYLTSGTNIALGFEAMIRAVSAQKCDHCIIIFISDGADDRQNAERRGRLQCLPCKSTLLTVAVGGGFPTSLVVNELRKKYHTFGGDSIPLVFPLSNDHDSESELQSDVQWVAMQLEEIIRTGAVIKELSLDDLEEIGDIETIFGQCKRWYNACTIQCMSNQLTRVQKMDLIKATKVKFTKAEELMNRLTLGLSKPLPSNLRARRPIFLLCTLRGKLNGLLETLGAGRLLDDMGDEEKKSYLSYGNVAGTYMDKANRYHAADFKTTKESLIRFLDNHKCDKADEELTDDVNLCSWAEYCEDARGNIDFFKGMNSLAGVLEGLPFVGRSVQLHKVPDCAQINPWLLSSFVKALPTTIKGISTHDLHVRCGGSMQTSQGDINAIIICGGDPGSPGIFCHMQTFCLLKNWVLYFNDIRLISASMIVLHILCNQRKPEEWHLEELSRAKDICALHTPENSRWWHDYLTCLKSPDFRKCLVTESVKLERWMMCPGLGKALLGFWWLSEQGSSFTATFTRQDLLERFQAVAVEFLGRCKLSAEDFYEVKRVIKLQAVKTNPVEEALRISMPMIDPNHLSMRTIHRLLQSELEPAIKRAKAEARKETVVTFKREELMNVLHFNLNLNQVQCFFTTLMNKQGLGWTGPTDESLMRALMTATSHSTSYDRNHSAVTAPDINTISSEKILDNMACKMAGRVCGNTRKELVTEAAGRVVADLSSRHFGLPRPIPAEYVALYMQETGRNIDEDWAVDFDTRLSPVACCFPGCKLYLQLPRGSEYRQRTVIRSHLHTCCGGSIPGLHLCVSRYMHLPTNDVIAIIESGEELGDPFLPRDVTRRLERGMGVPGGIPRSFAFPEEYKASAMCLERMKMPAKIKAAIDNFTKGDPAVLFHAIEDIKISLKTNAWSYAQFKEAFDAQYALPVRLGA